jgi:hypothetical protein
VGLHQCPSERKGEGVPVRSLRVPSHVPRQPQTAAKVRGFSLTAARCTAETDWLLEEAGFELSVPPERKAFPRALDRFRRPSLRAPWEWDLKRRLRGVEFPVALFDAADTLVPGNGGADMIWASALACSGDFLLRLTDCQGKDLIAEAR